jgi:hypothetical protein
VLGDKGLLEERVEDEFRRFRVLGLAALVAIIAFIVDGGERSLSGDNGAKFNTILSLGGEEALLLLRILLRLLLLKLLLEQVPEPKLLRLE